MRILVAESNLSRQRALSRSLLSGNGTHRITQVTTGAEFATRLLTENFDLAILDFYLPDALGDRVLARVQDADWLPPIIVTAIDGDPETEISAMWAGAAAFIPTSLALDPTGLHTQLARVMAQQQLSRQSPGGRNDSTSTRTTRPPRPN